MAGSRCTCCEDGEHDDHMAWIAPSPEKKMVGMMFSRDEGAYKPSSCLLGDLLLLAFHLRLLLKDASSLQINRKGKASDMAGNTIEVKRKRTRGR